MKELLVSLDITSPSLSLAELSTMLGRSPSRQDSHDKGDARFGREPFDETIWRLDSQAPKTASVEEHLESLVSQLPPDTFLTPQTLGLDCRVWINVGVLFDTPSSGFAMSRRAIEIISKYGALLEITCYPCA